MEKIPNFATEEQIQEIGKSIESTVKMLREELESASHTLKTIKTEIDSIETVILFSSDDQRQSLEPIRDDMMETKKTLEDFIETTQKDIVEIESKIEIMKTEDEERREKILREFDGTAQ